MKTCSTSYVLRELQIKTTVRNYCTPIRVAKTQDTNNKISVRIPGRDRSSYSLLVGMQNGAVTFSRSLAVSYKTKHSLTIRSSNHVPWCLPKGVKNLSPQKIHTQMFMAA